MSEIIDHHTVSLEAFDAVTHGIAIPEHQQSFQELILSSRKLLLNRFVMHARGHESQEGLSSVDDSLSVLLQLEKQDKHTIDELLLAPATGSWLARTVDRLENNTQVSTPLWAAIGFFGNIVAGFAHKHGVGFTLAVPAFSNEVHIPQQGTIIFTGSQAREAATITSDGKALRIYDGSDSIEVTDTTIESASWRPVRQIITKPQSSKDGLEHYKDLQLTVLLDDADPYNSGLGPYRPPSEEVVEWQTMLDAAWEILVEASPNNALQLSTGLSVIVPSPQRKPFEAYSSSDSISVGSIRASLPTSPLEAAEILVHEYCGHSMLNTLLLASPLTPIDTVGNTLYAPWRDDPRPSGGLLHGIYSFSRVVDFYNAVRQTIEPNDPQVPLVDFERTLWQTQAYDCSADLTNLWYGHQRQDVGDRYIQPPVPNDQIHWLFGEPTFKPPVVRDPIKAILRNASTHMTGQRLPWPIQNTPEHASDILSHVALAKADHRAMWKAYHLEADPAIIDTLSDNWIHRRQVSDTPVESKTKPDPQACSLHARAILMRHMLVDPEAFMADFEASEQPLQRADMALVLGESALAQTLYKEILAEDPLNVPAFIGAELSNRLDSPSRNKYFSFRLRKPQVLLALQKAILDKGEVAADYEDLTAWIFRRHSFE